MAARERAGKTARRRRPRRYHAAWRLCREASARQPRGRHLWFNRDIGAPPASLRGQYRLQRAAGAARDALLRDVARRRAAGDYRISGPPLVYRRAVPPRAEIAALRAAPAIRLLHRGGGRAEPASLGPRSPFLLGSRPTG